MSVSTPPSPAVPETPVERPAKNRAARTARLVIVLVGVFALVVTAGAAALLWPREPELGPSADYADAAWFVSEQHAFEGAQDAMWTGMNEALRDRDREAFLSYATGDAVDQLGLWWDNVSAIGWEAAAISPSDPVGTDEDTLQVTLGAQLAFAAHPARGSGNADAALQLIQGFRYTVTVTPAEVEDDEDRLIASIVPAAEPNPWDEGPIYVAKRDHVVLFGMADEQALVDATADQAEEGAVTALQTVDGFGADLPQDGFISAVTGDPERFQRWQYGTGTPWEMDVAGYARPALRPEYASPWLDPLIATGYDTSGTLVVMGPLSADSRVSTFVHEFAHSLHNTAAPGGFTNPPAAVMEGFARYTQWAAGVSEPRYTNPEVRDAIAARGADAFSDTALRGADAGTAYEAAGSYYAFVAANGGDPWQLAIEARTNLYGLAQVADESPEYSISAWQAWVAAQ